VVWWAVLLGATSAALFALRYALPSPPFSLKEMQNHHLFPRQLNIHAVAGSTALLVGPWQLSDSLRAMYPRVHRWLGRIYIAAALVAWLLAVFLMPTVTTGLPAASAFFLAGVCWIGFAALGLLAIRRRDMKAHRRWMLRSYAMAFTAATVHLYFHPLTALGISFEYKYPVSLWLSFLTNLLIMEAVLRWPGLQAKIRRAAPVTPSEDRVRSDENFVAALVRKSSCSLAYRSRSARARPIDSGETLPPHHGLNVTYGRRRGAETSTNSQSSLVSPVGIEPTTY
jgi:uncharacterized membrane protein